MCQYPFIKCKVGSYLALLLTQDYLSNSKGIYRILEYPFIRCKVGSDLVVLLAQAYLSNP